MVKSIFIVGLALLAVCGTAAAQDDFDTIYKYPDRKGENIKIIRGNVETETKDEVTYSIGAGPSRQVKRIEPDLVFRVSYKPTGSKAGDEARDKFQRGLAEFEQGNFEEAYQIFEKAVELVQANPKLPEWIGAYSRYYYARAYLEMGLQMEQKGIAAVLVKRRFQSAADGFKAFIEKHPSHRLQYDVPVPYATALYKMGSEKYTEAASILEGVRITSRNQYAQLRAFQAMKLKGDILKESGESDRALTAYKELLRVIPNEDMIDEITKIRQDVNVFIGMVFIDQGNFTEAEEYFKKILVDVSATGVTVSNLGKVYLSIGTCRLQAKDWEAAQWYFLHGCVAYFNDPDVHRDSLLNVIICLDELAQASADAAKKKQYVDALVEYYRQIKNSYGATKECMQAGKIYRKYKDS